MQIQEYLEHGCLKPGTALSDVEKICAEAIEYKLGTVCVPPLYVAKAKAFTAATEIKVLTVAGFPFGYSAIEAKVAEIVLAVIEGADEVELVINTGAVKNNDWRFLAHEINTIMPIIRGKGKKITVILETGLMSDTEIITACDMYGAAGVDYIKCGTGFIENGSILKNLVLIRKHLANQVQIKAASAIKNDSFAKDLINAGANRLCCDNSLKLIAEAL